MRRREFISLIISAMAWPFAARGQAGKVYRIGVLEPTPAVQNATNLNALRDGLRKLAMSKGKTWSSSIGQRMVALSDFRTSRPS